MRGESERRKDEGKNKEDVRLDKADKELKRHKERQDHTRSIACQYGDEEKEDFTSKRISKQSKTECY